MTTKKFRTSVDPTTNVVVNQIKPCDLLYVYIFRIGSVKKLRDLFNLSEDVTDDCDLYEWGGCYDLKERLKLLMNENKYCKDVYIELLSYDTIEPDKMDKVEEHMSNFVLDDYVYPHQDHKHLGAFHSNREDILWSHFEIIKTRYHREPGSLKKRHEELREQLAESKARVAKTKVRVAELELRIERVAELEKLLKESKARAAILEAKIEKRSKQLEGKSENGAKPAKKPSSKTKK